MVKFARVEFSEDNLDLLEISQHHTDMEMSVRAFFVPVVKVSGVRFASYSMQEINREMVDLLLEHEHRTEMSILGALEAAFRVDFLQRCYKKRKDKLSRAFRDIYLLKGGRTSLEDDILQTWKEQTSVPAQLISDIRGAFKYRHWLAHGRYWVPKLGQKYDYSGLYVLAEAIFENFPLEGVSDH
jgi:hypothetical protein